MKLLSTRLHSPSLLRAAQRKPLTSHSTKPPITMASQQPAPPTTAAPSVAVVTTTACPYCKRVKADLDGAGIAYQEVVITDAMDPSVLDAIKKASGQTTVPQVFVAGELVGGSTEVAAALSAGTLQELVERSAAVAPLPPAVAQAVASLEESSAATDGNSASPTQQELAALADAMAAGGIGGRLGSTFPAQAAVQWLLTNKKVATAVAAAELLGQLQAEQLVTIPGPPGAQTPLAEALAGPSGGQLALRWVADCQTPTAEDAPLNAHFEWFGPPRPAVEVSAGLRQAILELYGYHLTPDGRAVNYRAMAADPRFARYATAAAELQRATLVGLTRDEALSFWINVYNAMIVHATAARGAPGGGTLGRLQWFGNVSYTIGGNRYSANDVEHGVLRCNAPSPASVFSLIGVSSLAPKQFPAGDPRLPTALLPPLEPRIHFALNCGAASCPPIRVYAPDRLERGLEAAAAAFCSGEVSVDVAAATVELSSIFKWYGRDFGSKRDLLQFLIRHTPEDVQAQLEELEAVVAAGGDVKLRYRPYNWSVNDTK